MDRAPRKVFPYIGDSVICAAGILLIRRSDWKVLLIRESTNGSTHLSDLGGKVEETDNTPFDTAVREFCEESGSAYPLDAINIAAIYNPASKYMFFMCTVENSAWFIAREDGKLEWCDFKAVLPQLHPRMKGILINIVKTIRQVSTD